MLLDHVGRLGAMLAVSLAISGCTPKICRFDPATTRGKIRTFHTAFIAGTASLDGDDDAYTDVMKLCTQSLQCQSAKGDTVRWVTLALTVSGAVAGAVAVPALTTASAAGNAEWIAGLSGFSGGVNGYLGNLQQTGLSYEARVMERAQFLVKYEKLIEDYSTTPTPANLRKLEAHCVAYGTSMGLIPEATP